MHIPTNYYYLTKRFWKLDSHKNCWFSRIIIFFHSLNNEAFKNMSLHKSHSSNLYLLCLFIDLLLKGDFSGVYYFVTQKTVVLREYVMYLVITLTLLKKISYNYSEIV